MLTEVHLTLTRSWAGFTAMVLCTMRICTATGGALKRAMVRYGTTWITMVVAYIPATASAAMGSTSAALVRKRQLRT